ncbi:hypothetical protein K438DRAFT_1977991 [Mycena galopus ATCC 62051]|nr:hypothetical protein K438DRAFT_1977991 [Mycena galopus ATCC 62051]
MNATQRLPHKTLALAPPGPPTSFACLASSTQAKNARPLNMPASPASTDVKTDSATPANAAGNANGNGAGMLARLLCTVEYEMSLPPLYEHHDNVAYVPSSPIYLPSRTPPSLLQLEQTSLSVPSCFASSHCLCALCRDCACAPRTDERPLCRPAFPSASLSAF